MEDEVINKVSNGYKLYMAKRRSSFYQSRLDKGRKHDKYSESQKSDAVPHGWSTEHRQKGDMCQKKH